MISDTVLQMLHKAIPIYDKLANKDYLIICSISKEHPSDYYAIRIARENFWHLLGCKRSKNIRPYDIYNACLKKKDIKKYLDYTNNESSCLNKFKVFKETFNFIDHAKQLKVCDVLGTPEEFQFKLASGNNYGYIGYDKYKQYSSLHYPKTTRTNPLSTLNLNNQKKIQAVLSKNKKQIKYDVLEYEIGEGIYKNLRNNIPSDYITI